MTTHIDRRVRCKGNALPAEMIPSEVKFNGVGFQFAQGGASKPDAVVAKGQKIELPGGDFNKVYVVAASDDGDQEATFHVGDREAKLDVEDWGGFIGQWDYRLWKPRPHRSPSAGDSASRYAKWRFGRTGRSRPITLRGT